MQDMNEVLMLDMENSGGYARGLPEAGARFTFADRSGSALTNDSLDAAAQIAEVMSVYSVLHSKCRHMPASLLQNTLSAEPLLRKLAEMPNTASLVCQM